MPGLTIDEEDGRTCYTFSQSWVNTHLGQCPEKSRRELIGDIPWDASDSTLIGTAMHEGIEEVLIGGAPTDAVDILVARIDAEWDEVTKVKVTRKDTAIKHAIACFGGWYEGIYPQLYNYGEIERGFTVRIGEDDDWPAPRIYLKGTWDFNDGNGLWDWKTATQPYEQWQVDRYKIQPTAYTLAYAKLNGITDQPVPFNYAVMMKPHGKARTYTTTRGPQEWAWLEAQLRAIVEHVEAVGTDSTWTLNDQGWWCSRKWCPVWDSCKGQVLNVV